MKFKYIVAIAIFLVCSSAANAGIIQFNSLFTVTDASGSFSDSLIGESYDALIDVDDTCGANLEFGCSELNATLYLTLAGINVGTNAGWTNIRSAMSDFSGSANAPFTYADPVYNDVFFEFGSLQNDTFEASSEGPDDTNWRYALADGSELSGTFGITSRVAVPEPSGILLLALGLLWLTGGRATRQNLQ